MIFGQLGGIIGQHGIIMAPLGSSLELWGDKVGPQERLSQGATMPGAPEGPKGAQDGPG